MLRWTPRSIAHVRKRQSIRLIARVIRRQKFSIRLNRHVRRELRASGSDSLNHAVASAISLKSLEKRKKERKNKGKRPKHTRHIIRITARIPHRLTRRQRQTGILGGHVRLQRHALLPRRLGNVHLRERPDQVRILGPGPIAPPDEPGARAIHDGADVRLRRHGLREEDRADEDQGCLGNVHQDRWGRIPRQIPDHPDAFVTRGVVSRGGADKRGPSGAVGARS